jgi:predicted  nucleic acid-binding Zn-ribbon protein
MKKLILILIILFSASFAYAEDTKSASQLEEELKHLQSDYEKIQKEIAGMNTQLSALSLRIHDANSQLQTARRAEVESKHE